MIPKKSFPASVPHTAPEGASHPQLQPKNALTLPTGALARPALAEERRLSQQQAGRGSSGRPRPTGQAHRGGVRPRGGCPLPALAHHETLPPACLGTGQPVHPCRPDRQPGGVAGQSPCGKMRNGSLRPSAAFLACEVYLSTEGGRSQVPTHEMAQAIVSPSASRGSGS